MPCTDPKTCYPFGTTENGKQRYVFHKPENYTGESQQVPCGKCISCQLDRSKEWATRGVHEAQCHKDNSFITLTYSDEYLPENGSLDLKDFDRFVKRLRYAFSEYKINPETGRKKRYYHDFKYLAAGEYGSEENTHRPHLHFCLFGIDFPDKKYLFTNQHGDPVYTSELLSEIWEHKGHVTIGELNYRTVAYTARYTIKKIVKKGEEPQWTFIVDKETGETSYDPVRYRKAMLMQGKEPEFLRYSKGIGLEWWKKHHTDTDKDYVHVNYAKHKIPRYYDKKREQKDPESLERIKLKRKEKAKEIANKTEASELKSRDIIKQRQIKQLERKL
jgi:hypothetical protein